MRAAAARFVAVALARQPDTVADRGPHHVVQRIQKHRHDNDVQQDADDGRRTSSDVHRGTVARRATRSRRPTPGGR
ncbi:hypothetical protein [Prauserella cavernicola]|uniref:hypothetical protein n=1 Tax=Prauserella cavernicola TaxID=2800127 RepID=UPI00355744DD